MHDDFPPGGVVPLRRPTEDVGGNMHGAQLNAGVAVLRQGGSGEGLRLPLLDRGFVGFGL